MDFLVNGKFFFEKILFCAAAAALMCHLFQVTSSIDGLGHLQLPPEQPLQVFEKALEDEHNDDVRFVYDL